MRLVLARGRDNQRLSGLRNSRGQRLQGREAVFGYFGQLVQGTGGPFQAELEHLLADDDSRVVGIHPQSRGGNRAERDGKHMDIGCCLVFELRDGRVIDCREYFHELYAWDEFWS